MDAAGAMAKAPSHFPRPGQWREPFKVFVLAVVTLGVYAAVHHYIVNRELRDFGIEVDPRLSAIAFFPGIVLVIPYLASAYRTGERIAAAQEAEELRPTASGLTSLAAALVLFASPPYHQAQLNRIWKRQNSRPA